MGGVRFKLARPAINRVRAWRKRYGVTIINERFDCLKATQKSLTVRFGGHTHER